MIHFDESLEAPGTPTTAQSHVDKVSPTTGTTQNTYGAYVQIVGSLTITTKAITMYIASTFGQSLELRIGVGPAASEVVVINDLPVTYTVSGGSVITYTIPFEIASGSRVAVSVVNRTSTSDETVLCGFVFVGI